MKPKITKQLFGGMFILGGAGLLSLIYACSTSAADQGNSITKTSSNGTTTLTTAQQMAEGGRVVGSGFYQNNSNNEQAGPARILSEDTSRSDNSQNLDDRQREWSEGGERILGSTNPDQATADGCSAAALAVGIQHYKYTEANSADLVSIVGGRKLHRDAAAALKNMLEAASRDKVSMTIGSAFRSVAYQRGIIDRKKAQGQSDRTIYTVSAPAGYSEHQTGYIVDFSPIDSSFGQTKAYAWLKANGAKFGWEQSFTPEYNRTHGVLIEPWHWRFIGTDTAKQALLRRGVCKPATPARPAAAPTRPAPQRLAPPPSGGVGPASNRTPAEVGPAGLRPTREHAPVTPSSPP